MFYMVLICTPICTLVLIKCMETWRFLELESWTELKLGGNPNRSKQGWGNLVFKKIIVWTWLWYFEINWASAIFSIWVSVQHHIVSLEMWQQLAATCYSSVQQHLQKFALTQVPSSLFFDWIQRKNDLCGNRLTRKNTFYQLRRCKHKICFCHYNISI